MPIPIIALDVGTQNTVVVAGERRTTGFHIYGAVIEPTFGVIKGQIIDIEQVSRTIKNAIGTATSSLDVEIGSVVATFSSGAILKSVKEGRVSLQPNEAITEDELDAVEEAANSYPIPERYSHLYVFRQHYTIDGKTQVRNPIGMRGESLELSVLTTFAPQTLIDSLESAVSQANISVMRDDILYSPVADAYAMLSAEQRDAGALVINFGAGTVDYIAFAGGIVISTGTFAVGGEHITNDLCKAFQLSRKQAETLKLRLGSAVIQPEKAEQREDICASFGTASRSLSVHAIQTVTNARVDEVLRMIRTTLYTEGVLGHIHDRLILTGGTASLPGITTLAESIFQLPARCATLIPDVYWTTPPEHVELYTTAVGALVWSAGQESSPAESKGGFLLGLRRLFSK